MTPKLKRLDRFMVGYLQRGNTCYGKMATCEARSRDWVDPLTLPGARRKLRQLISADANAAIYELVPVQIRNAKRRIA